MITLDLKKSLTFAALLATIGLTACDEGDIVEQTSGAQTMGKTALLKATLTGLDSWPRQYSLVLAAFDDEGGTALTQKPVQATDGQPFTTSMLLTSERASTVALCVTNRLRECVLTFAATATDSPSGTDTIVLDAGTVDVQMYKAIQDVVFTPTCARCHGLGASPAAGLSLAEGQSYAQLVSHPAKLEANGLRVEPGNARASLLHKVVHGEAPSVPFDHSNMIKDGNLVTLIDNWIDDGARQ